MSQGWLKGAFHERLKFPNSKPIAWKHPCYIVNCTSQLRQWVQPIDQRHLQVFSEILAAILQSGSAVLGKWIPYLSHRNCQARAHLERLSYFLHNQHISAERFYEPMLRHVLSAFVGESVLLTLDTSMLWDQLLPG
jgi:hypothetical protein